jgi:hypothetical protein
MPGLISTGLLAFIGAWNELLFALTFTFTDTIVPTGIQIPMHNRRDAGLGSSHGKEIWLMPSPKAAPPPPVVPQAVSTASGHRGGLVSRIPETSRGQTTNWRKPLLALQEFLQQQHRQRPNP